MRIIPTEPQIAADEGFPDAADIFRRKGFGTALAELFEQMDGSVVAVLDAPWGSGKTTFVRMWEAHLKQIRMPFVHFDAFENDYHADAFAAIAGEIIAYSDDLIAADATISTEFKNRAVDVGKVLLRGAIKTGVRVATMGAIGETEIAAFTEAAGGLAGDVSGIADDLIKKRLESRKEDRIAFSQFRDALSTLALKLGESLKDSSSGQSKPLLFIIDELDRCKPPFALELIEIVKHLFSVEGVHFLLVTNLSQLEASVRSAYGAEVDAPLYLQKFYHLRVSLPDKPDHRDGSTTVRSYVTHLSASFRVSEENSRYWADLCQVIAAIAEVKELSLRTAQRVISYALLCTQFTNDRTLRLTELVAPLCVFKVCQPMLFRKATQGTLTLEDVSQYFEFDRWPTSGHVNGEALQEIWRFFLDPTINPRDENWQGYRALYSRYHFSQKADVVPLIARNVVDRFLMPNA